METLAQRLFNLQQIKGPRSSLYVLVPDSILLSHRNICLHSEGIQESIQILFPQEAECLLPSLKADYKVGKGAIDLSFLKKALTYAKSLVDPIYGGKRDIGPSSYSHKGKEESLLSKPCLLVVDAILSVAFQILGREFPLSNGFHGEKHMLLLQLPLSFGSLKDK